MVHRALTPPSGIFAGSTGNELEHDGHVTVMTMMGWVQVLTSARWPPFSAATSFASSSADAVGSVGD